MSENTNPGNFANRPTEEVKAIAAMGGKASHDSGAHTHNVNVFFNPIDLQC